MSSRPDSDTRIGEWMQTFSGKKFWPLDPRPEDFDIESIAHALSHECRFAGHTSEFYSVAEHSVRVSRLVERAGVRADLLSSAIAHESLAALLHDAAEAYLRDMPRPLKVHLPDYRRIYDRVEGVLAKVFGVRAEAFHSSVVKDADDQLLATEARDLMRNFAVNNPCAGDEARKKAWQLVEPLSERLTPWVPREAKQLFLARFAMLSRLSSAAKVSA